MTRRDAVRRFAAAGVTLSSSLLAACEGMRAPRDERKLRAARPTGDVVIGAAWPWERRKNLQYRNGMQLAVDEVNSAGGVLRRPLRLVLDDDDESVDRGRLVAQRFSSNPDVMAVIGHLQSYVSEPAAAIYDAAGLVFIAPTSTGSSLTTQGYRRVFRTIFTDRETGEQMAEYAARRGYARLAIYYTRTVYGREIANAFEERGSELGLAVVVRQSFDPNVETVGLTNSSLLTDWRGRDLDAIFIASDGGAAGAFIAQARRIGIKAPVLGADAVGTPELFASDARSVEGTVIAAPFHPDESREGVRRFVSAFEARYGKPPDASAALAYDAVRVLAHGMTTAGTVDPDRVADALRHCEQCPGVTGPFTFNDHGDLVGRSVLKVVARSGRLEFLRDAHDTDGAQITP
jgi:branched-chain amino acid transport system substrate-binding protein